MKSLVLVAITGVACVLSAPEGAQAAGLVSSFNPGLGPLEAIAFDPAAGTLFLYHDGGGQIRELTTAGVEVLPAIPAAAGAYNDTDLDFAIPGLTIANTAVPAGSLIAFNGDAHKVQALNKDTGALIAEVAAPISLQGGFVEPVTGALWGIDWSADALDELDPTDGHVLQSFGVSPVGSPGFGIYFGDADYCAAEDLIVVAGSEQTTARRLTPHGSWQGDIELSGLGISAGEIAGIAYDDTTRHLWIAGRSGTVYEVSGVCDSLIFWDDFESGDTDRWTTTSGA